MPASNGAVSYDGRGRNGTSHELRAEAGTMPSTTLRDYLYEKYVTGQRSET
jgi:hypothetical protein